MLERVQRVWTSDMTDALAGAALAEIGLALPVMGTLTAAVLLIEAI